MDTTVSEICHYTYVVIGGGIAGVTCCEQLSSECTSSNQILLISASPLVKAVTNFKQISKTLESFDVEEEAVDLFREKLPNVTVVQDEVVHVDTHKQVIRVKWDKKKRYKYDKLCICSGGKPKVIGENNPYVLGIRDTESVETFQARLQHASRVVVVGNGGIATELVYELEGCDIIWAIKHHSIGATFFDAGAATFFLPGLTETKKEVERVSKRLKYTGRPFFSGDGGVVVDEGMRTNLRHVYAAGDVCTARWHHSINWFQMRLWSQARQMGCHAARCMLRDVRGAEARGAEARGAEARGAEPPTGAEQLDFCFELFSHVTRFFGYKVVLLGRYNCQGLDTSQYQLLVRCTPGLEYIKCVLDSSGHMIGAILIGETDLEETFENLILNEMDLREFGEDLLNPDIDIEDFFD